MNIIHKKSLLNKPESTGFIGIIDAVIPITARILKIFEPIKFPRDMAFSLLAIAMIEAESSGILVPIETTEILMILSLTPNFVANSTAP